MSYLTKAAKLLFKPKTGPETAGLLIPRSQVRDLPGPLLTTAASNPARSMLNRLDRRAAVVPLILFRCRLALVGPTEVDLIEPRAPPVLTAGGAQTRSLVLKRLKDVQPRATARGKH